MSNPKTALELMKARYEAYTKGDIEFIKKLTTLKLLEE